jgi:hypothetical protein
MSHHETIGENETMKAIGDIYALKDNSLKPQEVYLGANIGVVVDSTGTRMSYMATTDYISGSLKTVEASLPADRKLELNATPFMDESSIQLYQGYIRILQWIVELGRVDIMVEVSQLSSYFWHPVKDIWKLHSPSSHTYTSTRTRSCCSIWHVCWYRNLTSP